MNFKPKTLVALSMLAAAPAAFAHDNQTLTGGHNQTVLQQRSGERQSRDTNGSPNGGQFHGLHASSPVAAPEIDPASAAGGLALLLGGLGLMAARRRAS